MDEKVAALLFVLDNPASLLQPSIIFISTFIHPNFP